ncbi:hypothetical protein NX059_006869 [Plenodomus lindquistii]|nr:hypothetical protein NX059_006869 [Plenodomus lindquistii]
MEWNGMEWIMEWDGSQSDQSHREDLEWNDTQQQLFEMQMQMQEMQTHWGPM